MLIAQKLAQKIKDAQSAISGSTPITPQITVYAYGIVDALLAAVVNNAPGTINGITAPGAPLSGGVGAGGVITLLPQPMLARTLVGIDAQAKAQLQAENEALINYIATGIVVFSAGTITGTCTNTPTSPGPLTLGAGTNGQITGLTGELALAAIQAVFPTVGPDGLPHYKAVIDYILENATVTYAPGSVVGVCPPAGGPLTLGAGVGGTIS